jgi:hypothetical protein
MAAYPQVRAGSAPSEVPADWGVYPNVFNLEESTFDFIEDVLAEVLALFPGRYIHKGGDEVQRDQWKNSPRTQVRMRELGITDPAGLQPYFTTRIARFLATHGRRLVGWDEILEPELPRSAVVMSWRGIDGAIAAASGGYDTVLAPDPELYFDNWQSRAPDEPSGRMKALVSLESIYRFDPMPGKVPEDQRHHVLGLQGNVWTEHIRSEERVAWMTFPRASFGVDIMNPCWIFRGAELDGVKGVVAAVGQVPFNYQIGNDIHKIALARPQTAAGEFEVHLGKCDGELLARVPLAPAIASHAVTVLPRAALRPARGRHDLCLRFAQHGLDPLWVIDWVQLVEDTP